MSHRSDYMSGCGGGGGGGEIMLFGVRVKVDPMRKCVSMNNLSDYEPVHNSEPPVAAADGGVGAGYTSADDAVPQSSNGSRDRKRGVPWTEEEHRLFLIGLQKVGKGYWRGISKEYVKTRNPTQVASHAQKYFLRRKNFNRRRRRSSLFDITTDSVNEIPMEEGKNHLKSPPQPVPQATTVPLHVTPSANGFSLVPFAVNVGPVLLSMQGGNPMENSALGQSDRVTNHSSAVLVHPVPVFPMTTYSTMFDRNLNNQMPLDPSALSLSLSLSSGHDQCSGFQVISSSRHGDSFVSVA